MDDYLTEYKFLKEFKRGSGVQERVSIAAQVLGSLSRIIQLHQLEDLTFTSILKKIRSIIKNLLMKKAVKKLKLIMPLIGLTHLWRNILLFSTKCFC